MLEVLFSVHLGDMNLFKRTFHSDIYQRFVPLSLSLSQSRCPFGRIFSFALLDCIRADFDCSKLVYIIFILYNTTLYSYSVCACSPIYLTPSKERIERERIANKYVCINSDIIFTLIELGKPVTKRKVHK